MILDFKEIPQANLANGKQDSFELFARDFLYHLGYKIISNPDRGADGQKDLIVEEIRKGVGGETKMIWLVSCKHYSHSGKSISQSIENDILDRVSSHHCNGFIGFYSTIVSSSLTNKLRGLESKIEIQVFDGEKIEDILLNYVFGIKLAFRYFPVSFQKYKLENPEPATLFNVYHSIYCDNCDLDLLEENRIGYYAVLVNKANPQNEKGENHNQDIYNYCCEDCDIQLNKRFNKKNLKVVGRGNYLDLKIPTVWYYRVSSIINLILRGETFEQKAMEKVHLMFSATLQYISRNLTTNERERLDELMKIPGELGGIKEEKNTHNNI